MMLKLMVLLFLFFVVVVVAAAAAIKNRKQYLLEFAHHPLQRTKTRIAYKRRSSSHIVSNSRLFVDKTYCSGQLHFMVCNSSMNDVI